MVVKRSGLRVCAGLPGCAGQRRDAANLVKAQAGSGPASKVFECVAWVCTAYCVVCGVCIVTAGLSQGHALI